MLRVIKDEVCVLKSSKAEVDNTIRGLDNFTIIYAMPKPNPIIVLLCIQYQEKRIAVSSMAFCFSRYASKYFETDLLLSSYFYDLLEKEQRRNFFLRLTVQTMQPKAILFTLQKDLVLVGAVILRLFLNAFKRTSVQSIEIIDIYYFYGSKQGIIAR